MHRYLALPVVEEQRWWMHQGERLAIEGLLSQLRPRLAVETGTFDGGISCRDCWWPPTRTRASWGRASTASRSS
jgi:hypothetical protein